MTVETEELNVTPEEIMAVYLKKDQRILHIGGDPSLGKLTESYDYTRIEISDLDLDNIPEKPYDYVVLSDALELVDDPLALILKVKNLAKSTIVYEFKYDEYADLDPSWKQPWKSIGLEYNLTREFDWVNNRFFGYATMHTCEMPYNGPKVNEDGVDVIR
jgi:hypothetical protein